MCGAKCKMILRCYRHIPQNVATISYRKMSKIEPLETNMCDAMCETVENINRILVKATQAMCTSQNKRVRRSKGREENERSRAKRT